MLNIGCLISSTEGHITGLVTESAGQIRADGIDSSASPMSRCFNGSANDLNVSLSTSKTGLTAGVAADAEFG